MSSIGCDACKRDRRLPLFVDNVERTDITKAKAIFNHTRIRVHLKWNWNGSTYYVEAIKGGVSRAKNWYNWIEVSHDLNSLATVHAHDPFPAKGALVSSLVRVKRCLELKDVDGCAIKCTARRVRA